MRTKRHMRFFPISIWWIQGMSMQTCSQGARCAITSTLMDRLSQTRVGHQKQRTVLSTAPEHDADHGEVDPGFFTARKHFVVKGEPAPGGKPGKRALHDPAPFEDMEASWADLLPIDHGILGCPDPSHATPGMLHDLHFPAEYLFDPLDEAALLVGDSPPRSTGVAGGTP